MSENENEVINAVRRNLTRKALVIRKHSPEILFVGGILGVVGGTVLACRATLKLHETLDEVEEDINAVKAMKKDMDEGEGTKTYTPQNYRKDVAYVYTKAGIKFVKLYGPAILVEGLGLAALTGSHVTLNKRNAGLTAAYATLSAAFSEYREKVAREMGPETEERLHHGIELDQHGEETKPERDRTAPYVFIYDRMNPNWQNDPDLTKIFIECQQHWANQQLRARGHVFLNEVLDALGIDRTKAGSVTGWVMGGDGDEFIDFGLYEVNNTWNGWETSILLNFNVDGVIWDKI